MRPQIRSAIRFSIVLVVLTAVVVWVLKRWPEYDVPVQLAWCAAIAIYVVYGFVKQDRDRRAAK